MKLSPLLTLLSFALPLAAGAQTTPDPAKKARVFVTDSDSWETKQEAASGFGSGGFGLAGGAFAHSGGGARPQTAEVIKTMAQRCPNLIVNNRPEMGDYILRLEHEGGKGLLAHKDKVAVFVRTSGDSIFSTSTISLGGSVQHACDAITKHWTANATALSALPTPVERPDTVAPASLTVEANVPGADIEVDGEFVGSAPSTLTVTPGRHTVALRKKGYTPWSRTMTVAGTAVHLTAELDAAL